MWQDLVNWFKSIDPIFAAFVATTFTWLVTAFGAAFVFFFRSLNRVVLDVALGFTGGVMVAASFWSLLNPAIELSGGSWIPAAIGFLLGALFLFGLDKIIPHLHINSKSKNEAEGVKTNWNKKKTN